MSTRTTNWRLSRSYPVLITKTEEKLLPGGSFVRPIDENYVPSHVLSDPRWKGYDKAFHVFCYSRFGIVMIPISYLEET